MADRLRGVLDDRSQHPDVLRRGQRPALEARQHVLARDACRPLTLSTTGLRSRTNCACCGVSFLSSSSHALPPCAAAFRPSASPVVPSLNTPRPCAAADPSAGYAASAPDSGANAEPSAVTPAVAALTACAAIPAPAMSAGHFSKPIVLPTLGSLTFRPSSSSANDLCDSRALRASRSAWPSAREYAANPRGSKSAPSATLNASFSFALRSARASCSWYFANAFSSTEAPSCASIFLRAFACAWS
jgi:hypothetical protein